MKNLILAFTFMWLSMPVHAELLIEPTHPKTCPHLSAKYNADFEGLFLRSARFNEQEGLVLSISLLRCSQSDGLIYLDIEYPHAFFVKSEFFEPGIPEQRRLHLGFIHLDRNSQRNMMYDHQNQPTLEVTFPYSIHLESFLISEPRFLAVKFGRNKTARIGFYQVQLDLEEEMLSIQIIQ